MTITEPLSHPFAETKVKMLQTATGSEDGFDLRTYKAGETYTVGNLLAQYFLRYKLATVA